MKRTLLHLIPLLALTALPLRGEDVYRVDPVHSSVVFSIKHLGVTDFYAVFGEISGTVRVDPEDLSKSSLELSIPVNSVDSRNPKRDQHLKSPDFFNAEQFPTINFKSTKIEGGSGIYQITGDLTLHGVTRSITVEFKMGPQGQGMGGETIAGGETRFTIKRSDFGMNFMQGALGDEVNLIVSLEAVKQ